MTRSPSHPQPRQTSLIFQVNSQRKVSMGAGHLYCVNGCGFAERGLSDAEKELKANKDREKGNEVHDLDVVT